MNISLQKNEFVNYLRLLLINSFPDNHSSKLTNNYLQSLVEDTLDKIEYCFKNIRLKYYNNIK